MMVTKYGVVIFTATDIKVEGWEVQREITDPPLSEASPEQMLLEVVIPWAQKKLNAAIMQNLQRISNEKKAVSHPTEKDLKLAGHVQYYGQSGTNPNPCVCIYCTMTGQNPTQVGETPN